MGPQCTAHERDGALQRLGRTHARDAADAERSVGIVHSPSRRGRTVQVRNPLQAEGLYHRQDGPVRLPRRIAPGHLVQSLVARPVCLERPGVAGPTGRTELPESAPEHLRGAPGQLDTGSGHRRHAQLPGTGPAAGGLLPGNGLHACPAAAGHGTSAGSLLGLSDHGLFCAHQPVRHTRRLPGPGRPLPSGGNRRHPRLGAGPFSPRTGTALRSSTAPTCSSTRIRARGNIGSGPRASSTSAGHRCATS